MFTSGVLAMGVLLVRTPIQFNLMRFLLGIAEGGFLPGMVFYLMSWFPAQARGRAIGHFYVALLLSSVVMTGELLGLNGTLGLSGRQYLLLVENVPAIALDVAILVLLPESPAKSARLSDPEKAWITDQLAADRAAAGVAVDRRLWLLGLSNACILGATYAFTLSAPTIVVGATHIGPTGVVRLAGIPIGIESDTCKGWPSPWWRAPASGSWGCRTRSGSWLTATPRR
jgi:ACS family tartrate transporter-like MFS transporter